MLLHFNLLGFIFALFYYFFALYYFTTLYFSLLFSFRFFRFPLVYFVHVLNLALRSLYAVFYLTLLYFSLHYIPVCFALLRFFTLPTPLRFTPFRIIARFAFLIFLGPVSAPVLTSSLLRTSRVLLFLVQLASLSLARPFYFPLFRFAPSSVNPGLWRNPSRIDGAT